MKQVLVCDWVIELVSKFESDQEWFINTLYYQPSLT